MPKYEIIDHMADVGILARGDSLSDVFINAALGMFSLITDLDEVEEVLAQEVSVEAPDLEELLVAWLNELLYLLDAENIIFSKFEITRLSSEKLEAVAHGEKIDPARHTIKTQVKAATYHMLKLREEQGFKAHIILDI